MTGPLTAQRELHVERLPDLPAGEEAWGELARAAGNPFSTWEWAAAWWRQFGAGREQRILGFHDAEGALVGVLPLYVEARRPIRLLRVIGHGPADQLEPACAPEHRAAVCRALKQTVEESRRELYVIERLPASDGWPERIGGLVTRAEPSPTIRFETDDWRST